MRVLTAFILSLLLAVSTLAYNLPLSKHQEQAVVWLLHERGYCTGFYVSQVTVLTASHCVKDGLKVVIGEEMFDTHLLKIDTSVDLALLSTVKQSSSVLFLAKKPPKAGEIAFIFSRLNQNPGGVLYHPLSILNPRTKLFLNDEAPFLTFMKPNLIPGQSGSPVLSPKGDIWGVAVMTAHPLAPHGNSSWAISWWDVKEFLQ